MKEKRNGKPSRLQVSSDGNRQTPAHPHEERGGNFGVGLTQGVSSRKEEEPPPQKGKGFNEVQREGVLDPEAPYGRDRNTGRPLKHPRGDDSWKSGFKKLNAQHAANSQKHQEYLRTLPPEQVYETLHPKTGKPILRRRRRAKWKDSSMLYSAIKKRDEGNLEVVRVDPRMKTEAVSRFAKGDSMVSIARALGIGERTLCNILAEAEVDKITLWGKSEVVRKIPKALDVYEHHLDQKNLDAARDVLQTTNIMGKTKEVASDNSPAITFNFGLLSPETAKRLLAQMPPVEVKEEKSDA